MGKKSRMGKSTRPAPPRIVILAGPNGAGKSTSAKHILRGALKVDEFVNADVIARGLSEFDPGSVSLAAGRVMLSRLKELASARATFAFETTLASKTFAPWIVELKRTGYEFHLVFLWLPRADMAVARVKDRVHRGGHDVPESTIRRRYTAGLRNFFEIYHPLADNWKMTDNRWNRPRVIAAGNREFTDEVCDSVIWNEITRNEQG